MEEQTTKFRKFRLFIPVCTIFLVLVVSMIVYPYFTFTYAFEKGHCQVERITHRHNRTIFTISSDQSFENCQKAQFNISTMTLSKDNETDYLVNQTYRCFLRLDQYGCPHFFWRQYRMPTSYKIIAGFIIAINGCAVIILIPIVIDMGKSFVFYMTCGDLHYHRVPTA